MDSVVWCDGQDYEVQSIVHVFNYQGKFIEEVGFLQQLAKKFLEKATCEICNLPLELLSFLPLRVD